MTTIARTTVTQPTSPNPGHEFYHSTGLALHLAFMNVSTSTVHVLTDEAAGGRDLAPGEVWISHGHAAYAYNTQGGFDIVYAYSDDDIAIDAGLLLNQ